MAANQVNLPLYIRAPFNHSVNEQQKDKAELLNDAPSALYVTGPAAAGPAAENKKIHLPLELWEIILSTSHCVDTCQTHLVFKRARFFNRDTYYTFSGTLREFQRAADVLFVDYLLNSDKSEGDDLPWDSGCSGACQGQACPMDRGAICSSIWQTMEFASEKELRLYESLIPRQYSYWGWYEVINMQPLAGGSHMCYSGFSQGDTHESISGHEPSKGQEETCATCGEEFYISDRHFFDDDQQVYYCGGGCRPPNPPLA
jgi:hypothetical protein